MSAPTAKDNIRYEQPVVVRRDSIAGLADGTLSDQAPPLGPGPKP